MVEKMKYISITGHIASMNHVVNRYLARYDIQLAQAPHFPGQMEPFSTLNPYTQTLVKADNFLEMLGPAPVWHMPMSGAAAVNLVEAAQLAYELRGDKLRQLEQEHKAACAYIHRLQHFVAFDAPLANINTLEFLHCRFGRMPVEHFKQYETFLHDDEKILLQACKRSRDYAWVVYFTPNVHKDEVDAVFSSLNFEAIPLVCALSDTDYELIGHGVAGTYPSDLLDFWRNRQVALEEEIQTLTKQSLNETVGSKNRLLVACEKVRSLYATFDVKKHAALSKGRRIFTFVGWMSEKDAKVLASEIDHDELAVFTRYGETEESPPIRLKNPPIIRQFEFFTRLYGLPVYNEIDPTPLLAVTYTLLFGLMFGDVGHGLTLALLGLYIHLAMGKPLGGILMIVGASAMGFGFLYGSIFGFEDILPALWRRPMADIAATLLFAVGVGVALIVLSMCLYMFNAARKGRIADLLFGANGVAGLLFYSAVLWLAFRTLFWGQSISPPVVGLALTPLVLVALKRPITRMMERQPDATHEPDARLEQDQGIGMNIFSTFIELFETLLTYVTNTISFVRVGAFAISHAGMMHVVLQLSQGAAGSRNLLVLILGNILVMAIEGLLVGIQVLRLDFYEIFSRFYTGGGRGFASSKVSSQRQS